MKSAFTAVCVSVMLAFCAFNTVPAYAATTVMKEGMRGSSVSELQRDLKALGYFNLTPTGYYGNNTENSVKRLQAKHGLVQDGKAGPATLLLISSLLGNPLASVSRNDDSSREYLVPWFGGAERILSVGKVATVYDIKTGLSFNIKRTYGYNHADCETISLADTNTMKKIYGGSWSWDRRAVIVTVDGRKMAASMAGMPHAGVESAKANAYVSSRSGGYGRGANLDAVKENNMSGVFDLHFLGSKTHGTNKVDANHQNMIKAADEWAKKNY